MIGITYDAELTPGSGRAGCQVCRRVFMTAGLFDKHLTARACHWSDEHMSHVMGLVETDAGVWATPGQVEKVERMREGRKK